MAHSIVLATVDQACKVPDRTQPNNTECAVQSTEKCWPLFVTASKHIETPRLRSILRMIQINSCTAATNRPACARMDDLVRGLGAYI